MMWLISLTSFSAGAETVITTDQGVRGGKIIELKSTVDQAVSKCDKVKRVFVSARTGANIPMGKLDIPLEQVINQYKSKNIGN